MNMRIRVGIVTGMALIAVGCLEHTYDIGRGAPRGRVVYDEWHHHWLGGLIGERELDIGEYCPSGNATIHDEQSFLNGLVAALTSGIYMPTTVTIRCARRGRRDLQLDENDLMTILTAPEFLERVERMLPDRYDEVRLGVAALQQDLQD
ncbi:MAG: Bor family protein [Gemmatimonadota bacterium]|nr:Bor family protein [Gemmatimonadota bacterium]